MHTAFQVFLPSQSMTRGPLAAVLAGMAVLFICCTAWLAAPSPAEAGVWYPCEGMHRFGSCMEPTKPPPPSCGCQPVAGDPVDILTGRLSEEVVDWSAGGSYPLELKRSYTSNALTLDASPYSMLGRGWRTNFDARVRLNAASISQATWAHFILPDSFEYNFNKVNGTWQMMAMEWSGQWWSNMALKATKRSDLDITVTMEGQQFVLRTPGGVTYVFDTAAHAPDAQWRLDGYRTQVLSEIRFPGC